MQVRTRRIVMEKNGIKKWNSMQNILWKIKDLSPLSKKELQDALQVSWGLVSKVVNALEEEGFIISQTRKCTGVGRNAEEFDINPNKYLSVGVEITCDSIITVVTDLKGRIVESDYVVLEEYSKECALETINKSLDKVIGHYNKEDLLGIGFGVQGIVDREKGISDHIHKIIGWDYVPLKEIYEDRYDIKVNVEHDTDCLMKSEVEIGGLGTGIRDIVLCKISHRFGVGITSMMDGKICRGANGKAGEIGSSLVGFEEGEPIYLNDLVKKVDVIREYEKAIGEKIEYTEFEEKIKNNDEKALEVYRHFADKVSFALSSVCSVFDPGVIIFHTENGSIEEVLYEMIEKNINESKYDKKMIVAKSKLSKYGSAIGAALNTGHKAVNQMLDK